MCHAFIWMGRKGEVMGEGELGGVCVCVNMCANEFFHTYGSIFS